MHIFRKILVFTLALCLFLPLVACPAGPKRIGYEEYIAMTGKEQQAYYEQFPDVESFFAWYHEAKAEYEASRPEGGEDSPDVNIEPSLPGLGGGAE